MIVDFFRKQNFLLEFVVYVDDPLIIFKGSMNRELEKTSTE